MIELYIVKCGIKMFRIITLMLIINVYIHNSSIFDRNAQKHIYNLYWFHDRKCTIVYTRHMVTMVIQNYQDYLS